MKYATVLVIAILALLIPIKIWIHFGTMETVTGYVIQDKERVTTGSGKTLESKYLIFTDRETFENTDSYLSLKFNSSDIYGAIPVGGTCDFSVTGIRLPFFSSYRNILSATCH